LNGGGVGGLVSGTRRSDENNFPIRSIEAERSDASGVYPDGCSVCGLVVVKYEYRLTFTRTQNEPALSMLIQDIYPRGAIRIRNKLGALVASRISKFHDSSAIGTYSDDHAGGLSLGFEESKGDCAAIVACGHGEPYSSLIID
jgi:hypothetical protein